jgi:hypothetical protein
MTSGHVITRPVKQANNHCVVDSSNGLVQSNKTLLKPLIIIQPKLRQGTRPLIVYEKLYFVSSD